jgi:ribulose kinase
MQIYSDGCGRDLVVAGSPQASALAAAMLGPVAAGPDRGGHASLAEAVARMDDAFGRTSAAMQRLRELRMRGVR